MLNLKLMKERKRVYGDNFEAIAKVWEMYLNEKLGIMDKFSVNAKDVAKMMMLMKECRIDAISKKLEECSYEEEVLLRTALQDSLDDRDNYEWIAENYEEYKRL